MTKVCGIVAGNYLKLPCLNGLHGEKEPGYSKGGNILPNLSFSSPKIKKGVFISFDIIPKILYISRHIRIFQVTKSVISRWTV